MILTIRVNGFDGHFRADVLAFNKYNKGALIDIMHCLGLDVPLNPTLQEMKEVAREYDDTYPCGFKHIGGKFCYYQVLG